MNDELKIYCDGGARGNPGPAAAAFVVEQNGKIIFKDAEDLGETTNNVAEYAAVILALKWLKENQEKILAENVFFILDSELITKQLNGLFKIKNEKLRNLFFTVKTFEKETSQKIFYRNVPRSQNKLADFLVNRRLDDKIS